MRCFKLRGERVMARTFDRQVAELQVRAVLLNHFTALGRSQTVALAQIRPGSGKARSQFICTTEPHLGTADRPGLIALTCDSQPKDWARAAAPGFDSHLVKPVSPAPVVAAIEALVR